MTPFLKQVARHYIDAGGKTNALVFVFPSQRAVVFFRKYFAEVIAETGKEAAFIPQALSIDDFFARLSTCRKVDRILLLLRLYDCYSAVCGERGMSPEELDKFIFWGEVILSDFDDVDKYLVNASDLFLNVSQYKDMQDDFEDLSLTQKAAIREFLGHFVSEGEYKKRFASTWNILGPLYELFNRMLSEEGIAYEGMLYRSLVKDVADEGAGSVLEKAFPHTEKVVFCGLNALNECEKNILGKLRDIGRADFCWDYVSGWISDRSNKSSFFLKDNVQAFPQAFPLEKCERLPEFEVVQVPSAVGQTKLMTDFLSSPDIPADESTAVLLPDESLLLPLLNSIPERVGKVNVTMGFPMTSSSFFSLMDDISQLQLHIREKDGRISFYHKYVWNIVSNNIFAALCDDSARTVIESVKDERRYYVPADSLSGSPLLDLIFRTPRKKEGDVEDNAAMASYLTDILNFIGQSIASDENLKTSFSLELDFAMEYVKTVNLLSSRNVPVPAGTWLRLLRSLLQSKSIPFKGEPLRGLQIMGPLEIRALDFDKLFILSCNEAVFPRKSSGVSFIPPFLRHGFGLPTYEYQDAVWAYYFYRMIQRPSKVWMLMDTRTEGLKSGEESRYVKQLEYHFNAPLVRKSAIAVPRKTGEPGTIAKTKDHIRIMHSKPLSASALKKYLSCPAEFYYSFIEGLKEEDEVSESLDAGMTGNVFHKVMETIYRDSPQKITAAYLDSVIRDKVRIRNMVEDGIMKEMHSDSIHGRDLVVSRLIQKYVVRTLERDKEFAANSTRGWFAIVGLEEKLFAQIGKFRLKGFIDRLDSFASGEIRVVDYKTGNVLAEDVNINDSTADRIIGHIFSSSPGPKPEIALQFFIYDYLLNANGLDRGNVVFNSVYSTRKLMSEAPVNVIRNEKFYAGMYEATLKLLGELENEKVGFSRTENRTTCQYCHFRTICGR